MKRTVKVFLIILSASLLLTGMVFGSGTKEGGAAAVSESGFPVITHRPIVVGFSQIGSESKWRTANTISV